MTTVAMLISAALWVSASMTLSVDAAIASDCLAMDLVLVMPTGYDSTSWDQIKQYASGVLTPLNIDSSTSDQNGTRVAVITYRDHATLNFDFKRYATSQQIITAIDELPQQPGDLSDIGEAFSLVENYLIAQCNERNDATCVVMAMFDNYADDPDVAERYESDFNLLGVQLLTVGLTLNVDTDNDLTASNTSYNRLYDDYTSLSQAVTDSIDLVCSYRPPNCNAVADIGFILDESASIVAAAGGMQNWYHILDFLEATVNTFPIAPNLTRIGVTHFASTAKFDFAFSTYSDSATSRRAIQKLMIQGGDTNTSGGFYIANTQLFPGRRPGVKTVCIIITDGQPNRDISTTYTRANETKALGIDVIAVGITNKVQMSTLKQLASSPSFVFTVTDYVSIEQILTNLTALLCQEINTKKFHQNLDNQYYDYNNLTTTTTTPPTVSH